MLKLRSVVFLLLILVVTGCASLRPNFETPTVSVSSFRALPGNSIVPTFEIGLHVINPNRTALKLQGISYNVELEGYRVLSGVSSQLPTIAAYGEGDVILQARPDLFSTLSLFTNLINQPRDSFNFNVVALLDIGGILPKIRVEKEGVFSLTGAKN